MKTNNTKAANHVKPILRIMLILGIAVQTITLTACGGGDKNAFADPRDGKKYKFATIGGQTWMAENLNYEAEGSKCGVADTLDNLTDESTEYCEKHGRLYTWATAMALTEECNEKECADKIEEHQRGICPEGWHLPSNEEWNELLRHIDSASGGDSAAAARYLKSKEGWENDGGGEDKFGFAALPGGYASLITGLRFWFSPGEVQWLSSSQGIDGDFNPNGEGYMFRVRTTANLFTNRKNNMNSVRCIQNGSNAGQPKEAIEKPAAAIEYGTLADSRDKKAYKTIAMGEFAWMAENLNYASKGSLCYDNKPENCSKYGRLYPSDIVYSSINVCPRDWHLATSGEWYLLYKDGRWNNAMGVKLKAGSGWNDGGNGTDNYGFAALPGGYFNKEGAFSGLGEFGGWWNGDAGSLTADYPNVNMLSSSKFVSTGGYTTDAAFLSARCVKNYKCGKTLYNPLPANACCDDTAPYDYYDSFCHKGKIYALCGGAGGEYDPDTQFCHSSGEGVADKCGGKEYDLETKVCNDGKIGEKCGDKGYNPETHFCRDGEEIEKCGGREYDPEREHCHSDGETYSCGGKPLNPETQFCDYNSNRENVLDKCGGKEYRPATEHCQGETVKEYKTVEIGEQTWMAENLNYAIKGSQCYENKPENCDKHGRLYVWSMAKIACPKGWHLPQMAEWNKLLCYADGIDCAAERSRYESSAAGKLLKAKAGWKNNGNGEDKFGFAALPTFNDSSSVRWWNATDSYDANIHYLYINAGGDGIRWDYASKSNLFSVRCVKD